MEEEEEEHKIEADNQINPENNPIDEQEKAGGFQEENKEDLE